MAPRVAPSPLEHTLARLSADEMVAAIGLAAAPAALRRAARAAFLAASMPLARVLARFEARIDLFGVARAAAAALGDLGASWRRDGPPPPARGALLVVSNHPGAYDTLGLLAALERDDVSILAADRVFLRAMPALARHLVFVGEGPASAAVRARGLRCALRRLKSGGVLVHFGAGRIEPDPAFLGSRACDPLASWPAGTGALVRGAAAANGKVVVAAVEGVHSPRAKRLMVTRVAERRGLTTLAPLLQIAVRAYHDVDATMRMGSAVSARDLAARDDDARITALLRGRVRALIRPD